MGDWSSLGGYGNVNARMPLPVGQTDNTGALGMIMQALMRQGAMRAPPQPMPEDDDDLARLLAEAFGMAPQATMSVHAAFDPAKRKSGDLLASLAGAGLLGATAARLYGDDEQHR